MYFIFLRIQ